MHVSPEVVLIKTKSSCPSLGIFFWTYHNGHSPRSSATSDQKWKACWFSFWRRLYPPSYIKDNEPWNQKSINQGFWECYLWVLFPSHMKTGVKADTIRSEFQVCGRVSWRSGWATPLLGRKIRKPSHGHLVGSFDPIERYDRQIGSFPQGSGWKWKSLKPPPSHLVWWWTNVDNWSVS